MPLVIHGPRALPTNRGLFGAAFDKAEFANSGVFDVTVEARRVWSAKQMPPLLESEATEGVEKYAVAIRAACRS